MSRARALVATSSAVASAVITYMLRSTAALAFGVCLNLGFLLYAFAFLPGRPEATGGTLAAVAAAALVLVGAPFLYLLAGKAYGAQAALAKVYAAHREPVLRLVEERLRRRDPALAASLFPGASPAAADDELPRPLAAAARFLLKLKGLPERTVERLHAASLQGGGGAHAAAAAAILDDYVREELLESNPWPLVFLLAANLAAFAALAWLRT